MTQPVQEPLTQRSISTLTWGQNQLYRRPGPPQGDTGSDCRPWIGLVYGFTTIPTATEMPVPNNTLFYDPDLVTEGDIFSWDITDSGDPGNDRFEITTHVEGWYEVELVTVWDQTSTAGTEAWGAAWHRISWSSTTNFLFDMDIDIRASADWQDFSLGDDFEMLRNPWLHTNQNVFVPGTRIWLPSCYQTTGVDRGIGADMRIWFTCADDSATWTEEIV